VNRVMNLTESEGRPLRGQVPEAVTFNTEDDMRASAEDERSEIKAEAAAAAAEVEAEGDADAESGLDPTHLRIMEALLFAASEPLNIEALGAALPAGTDVDALLRELQGQYDGRGVNLVKVAGKWQFRTAKDLGFLLHKEKVEERRLSRAAIETLSIIAYHQPVTRAEIEDIRGVMVSKGTIDALMEVGWIRIRGRRRTPGRPVTYGTTEAFMVHFGLEAISDLPGMEELKAAGFLESAPPNGFSVPNPSDALAPDEDPYEGDEQPSDLFVDPRGEVPETD
jgi:segregation and condensation protein B